ncbi:MAG: sensor histidine kinase [Myxococcota bacterium]
MPHISESMDAPSHTGPSRLDSGVEQNPRAWLAVALLGVIATSAFHYWTDSSAVEFHNVYRRLYYIPIVLAAFSHGVAGGLGVAALACLAYTPHAFFMTHGSPSPAIDKGLEMVLYMGIGGLTGWLVQRQVQIQHALERSLMERDELEESLVRAGKLSALGRLTSGLAHEIRNPLASIMGSAESLADEFDESHRKYRLSRVMLKEINRLNDVVSDFLSFARPNRPERRPVDPIQVAHEVVALTSARARDADVRVSVEPETGIREVEGDANQLSQVILNILLNAYEALETSQQPRRVTIVETRRTLGDRRYYCLGIQDNGPGIPGEEVDRIFDPYFTTRDEGTGLGLSISSRIVETHGGFIDVETPDKGGTIFWICLPEESS